MTDGKTCRVQQQTKLGALFIITHLNKVHLFFPYRNTVPSTFDRTVVTPNIIEREEFRRTEFYKHP